MHLTRLLYILLLFHFLMSCSPTVHEENAPAHLVALMAEAEDLRFRNPEVVDTMLSHAHEAILNVEDDHLRAQYYFISAHILMLKGYYTNVASLLDSVHTCPAFVDAYQSRIHLINALVCERRQMYESAYEYYKKVLRTSASLTDEEQLMVLLGTARIRYWLSSDYKTTFQQAQDFVSDHKGLDMCIFHSYAVLLDSNDKRFEHLKQSEHCAQHHGSYYLLLQNYIQHAAFEQDQDSIAHYLAKAKQSVKAHQLDSMYCNTTLEASCMEIESKLLQAHGKYDEAMPLAQAGIALSLKLKMEDKAYRLSLLLSDMQYAHQQYDLAMQSKDLALECRLAYSQRVNGDKIKYIEAKDKAAILRAENDVLLEDTKHKTFQLRLFLIYSIIVSLIIYLLYVNRKGINDLLLVTKRKMQAQDSMHERYKEHNEARILKSTEEIHRKNMMLKDKQVRLEKITSLVKESPYKDKSKLNKIEDLVSSDQVAETWDLFYEVYQYKFPNGEMSIRSAFPSLSPKDYKYLMCIHYGLSHDKIATLFSIQPDSVRKRCFRLKTNFGISRNTDIKNFVLSHISA